MGWVIGGLIVLVVAVEVMVMVFAIIPTAGE